MTETRTRRVLYNEMMNIRHGDVRPMVESLKRELIRDPDWVGRLCTWLALPGNTENRDLQEAAMTVLLTASLTNLGITNPLIDFRECGQALLLGSDFYDTNPQVPGYAPFRILNVFEHVGDASPRRMRSIWERYLSVLSQNKRRLDGVAARNKRRMKIMWRRYHTSSGMRVKAGVKNPRPDFPRANAILFGEPPKDSSLSDLERISEISDPVERAKALVKGKHPLTVFTSIVGEWTPAIAVAALMVMSPAEALNSTSLLERYGVLENPDVFAIYEAKVKKATKSAATVTGRKSVQSSSAKVQELHKEVEQAAVDESKPISGFVGFAGDKSGSMQDAINTLVQLLSHSASRCEDGFAVAMFDDMARLVDVQDTSISGLRGAFSYIRPGGMTNITAALELLRSRHDPDRYVIVSDEGHNRGRTPAEWWNTHPEVQDKQFVFLTIGGADRVFGEMDRVGANVSRFQIQQGEMYVLDQVASALSGDAVKSIVDLIMETELVKIIGG